MGEHRAGGIQSWGNIELGEYTAVGRQSCGNIELGEHRQPSSADNSDS